MTGSDDIRAPHLRNDDFLGAFAVIERGDEVLMVQNRRHIGGRDVLTWDLPGGQVEPGETLVEALVRELREELGVVVPAEPEPAFLFFQEGERVKSGARRFVWRSFFFGVEAFEGEPVASCDEVLALRWMPLGAMARELTAPYHDSFVVWLRAGRPARGFASRWDD